MSSILRTDLVEQPDRPARQRPSDQRGHHEFPEERSDDGVPLGLAGCQAGDSYHSQQNGHGVIGGTLDFQCARQPVGQRLPPQDRKCRRRIRRRDNHRQQDCLVQRPPQQSIQNDERDGGRKNDAPRRHTSSRQRYGPEIVTFGAESALKEDEYQRHVGYPVRQVHVVKVDEIQHVAAEQNARAQRNKDDRNAPAVQPDGRQHHCNQNDRANDIEFAHDILSDGS